MSEQNMQEEEKGLFCYTFEGHIILCEWNYRSRQIIEKLRRNYRTRKTPIVLIANIDKKPIDYGNLFFVKGSVNDETLQQANVKKAKTVIILGDDNLDDVNRDTKVALSTLTVETINRSAYTIVELVNENYVEICNRAHADEIIVSSNLSSQLIVDSIINDGISNVIFNLLSKQYDNQLYKIPVPEDEVNRLFIDVFARMKEHRQSIVIAIQQGEGGDVITNPSSNYTLRDDDYLIMIFNYNKYYFSALKTSNK
ncbi:MAG: NAD-binding protein [Cyanobacteria bacterium J06635_10]